MLFEESQGATGVLHRWYDAQVSQSIWQNYFDIVILPAPDVRDHSIALSKQLEPYSGKFVLGLRQFLPHISLYHIPVLAEHFAKFADAVKDVASRNVGGPLNVVSMEMPVLMTDKPAWLGQLHLEIVEATKDFLDRSYGVEATWRMDYLPAALQEQARHNLIEFGSPLIDAVFRPHITLTSFLDHSVAKQVPPPSFLPLSFKVDSISICELGPSHTCQRIVETYPLARR